MHEEIPQKFYVVGLPEEVPDVLSDLVKGIDARFIDFPFDSKQMDLGASILILPDRMEEFLRYCELYDNPEYDKLRN